MQGRVDQCSRKQVASIKPPYHPYPHVTTPPTKKDGTTFGAGPAQVILQLGSPARTMSPQPEHQQPLSELLTSQPELDLFSTGSDLWGEPHAASLPSALSTPLRVCFDVNRVLGAAQRQREPACLEVEWVLGTCTQFCRAPLQHQGCRASLW